MLRSAASMYAIGGAQSCPKTEARHVKTLASKKQYIIIITRSFGPRPARRAHLRVMATSGAGRAEEGSRRDSLGEPPRDLGQGLLETAPRPKYDDPGVAVTVLTSERKHLDAVFKNPNRKAARDARAATTETMKGLPAPKLVYQVRRNLLVYSFPDVHGGQPPRQLPIPWKNRITSVSVS